EHIYGGSAGGGVNKKKPPVTRSTQKNFRAGVCSPRIFAPNKIFTFAKLYICLKFYVCFETKKKLS
ncbi:hypothetical protein, partial [Enterobacter hormaechei]